MRTPIIVAALLASILSGCLLKPAYKPVYNPGFVSDDYDIAIQKCYTAAGNCIAEVVAAGRRCGVADCEIRIALEWAGECRKDIDKSLADDKTPQSNSTPCRERSDPGDPCR